MNGLLNAMTGISLKVMNMMGALSYSAPKEYDWEVIEVGGKFYALGGTFGGLLKGIMPVIDMVTLVLLIAVGAAGTLYAVILGVNLARAEDAEKREAAKKRLIWAVVGVVSIVVICLILQLGMGPMVSLILGDGYATAEAAFASLTP